MKRRSEHGGEDTISENSQYGLKMIILVPSLKKKKRKDFREGEGGPF